MKTRAYAILMLLGMLLVSCGGEGGTSINTEKTDTDKTMEGMIETEAAEQYQYPVLDCGGEALRILNSDNAWGTYGTLDLDEATGESLDDIIYTRNRNLEERFNMVIRVDNDHDIDAAVQYFMKIVQSGEDLYDVAYLRADNLPSPLTQEMLCDLEEIDGFHFDQPWWDAAVVEGGHIGNERRLYFASNYHSLFGFDSTVCLFFNERVFDNLDMEFPYQQVRDGKWTIDRLFECIKIGSNLNGDADFSWNGNGNAVYGIATWSNGYHALLNGAGAYYAMMDENGTPEITVNDPHFVDVVTRMTENVFAYPGGIINSAVSNPPYDHATMLKVNRALFSLAQVKTANFYRDMEDSFGILPLPKYDEAQEKYSCYISSTQLLMCIPVTNGNTERTALLMDALAYESYRDVLPIYYEEKISQKGLRNEDSIEMLDIIRANRYVNFGEIFGWTNDLQGVIYNKINAGNGNIASDIAASLKKIESRIENTMEMVNQ